MTSTAVARGRRQSRTLASRMVTRVPSEPTISRAMLKRRAPPPLVGAAPPVGWRNTALSGPASNSVRL